ncbi:MAG: hypothetical protein J5764_03950 [Bacteroidales bacterium]|nr:hypothetical protein [Bacteroidales bacterium]
MYKNDLEEDGIPHCLECGEILYGRSDKKFCGATCRNAWHSHFRSGKRLARSLTLNGLTKNYKILEDLISLKQKSCPLDSLTVLGFNPELITHQAVKNGRHTEYRCFDIAYCQSSAKIFNLHRLGGKL